MRCCRKDTRNLPPAFVDQDTETDGTQNETATREVEENTKALAGAADDDADADALVVDNPDDNVGSVVTANDPDPNSGPADLHAERCRCRFVQGEEQWSDRGSRGDEVGLRGDQERLHGDAHGRGLLRRHRLHHS